MSHVENTCIGPRITCRRVKEDCTGDLLLCGEVVYAVDVFDVNWEGKSLVALLQGKGERLVIGEEPEISSLYTVSEVSDR